MKLRPFKLSLRLSEREHQHLKEQAALSGYSKEQYIRGLIAEEKMQPRPPGELIEIRRELNAIGNNINQIACKVNATGHINRQEMSQIISFQQQIWALAKRI